MRLTFTIEIAASPESRHPMSFASDMAAKVAAQRREQEQRDAVFLERRRLIRARAVPAWEHIREWFERTVVEFNREVGSELLVLQPRPSTELSLRYTPPGTAATGIDLTFNAESSEIRLHNLRKNYRDNLAFQLDGETFYLAGLGGRVTTLEASCEELMKMVFE